MPTLGIETSCDETAAAVVKDGVILSSEVSSSVGLHSRFGGVVPEIASRFHLEYINYVVKKALARSEVRLTEIDLVSAASRPGLAGSLLVGTSYARALSFALDVPLDEVDHLEAHIYANFLKTRGAGFFSAKPSFPFIGVVLSGGHTNIFICRSLKDFHLLGQTQDDAVGEAFDKVSKILGLGYPGGPIIEKRASQYRGALLKFPRSNLKKDSLDFSFSGIKTAVYYYTKGKRLSAALINQVASSFQEAVFETIADKVLRALEAHNSKMLAVGGGVCSNLRLRTILEAACKGRGIKLLMPDKGLCLDNAAMIAGLASARRKGVG